MAGKACPPALSSECGQRAFRGPSLTKTQQRGPKRFNFLRDRSPGVGARGRSPRESADPGGASRAGGAGGREGRGGRKSYLGHQSVFFALPESKHFAAARTCGRALRGGWESQSSPGDRQGKSWGPRAIPGRKSGGHFGTPGRLRGCTFGSSEHDSRSPGRLGRLKFGLQVPRSAR